MAVSTTVDDGREIIQFGISAFQEAREINFHDTLKVNMMKMAYFYVTFLRFTKKFLSLLTL